MAKQDSARIITPKGKLHYPWLRQPDTRFKESGSYKSGIILTEAELAPIKEVVEKLVDIMFDKTFEDTKPAARAALHKVYPWKPEYVDDEETGNFIITGKSDFAPKVVDAANVALPEEVNPYGGSIGRLSLMAKPYYMSSTKAVGVKLYLQGVQILALVERGGNTGFTEEEGYTQPSRDTDDVPFD